MNHDDAQSLLAAYALDAVDHTEAAQLREHLVTCPRCRHELAAFEEAASSLGNLGGEAPAQLWARISASLEEDPPAFDMPGGTASEHRLVPRARARVLLAAVAACLVAVAILGWDVSHLDERVGHLQSAMATVGVAQAAEAAALSPHSRHLDLRSASGALEAEVAVRPDGEAYLVSTTLPRLAGGRTYQMWGLVDRRAVSLGLLGSGSSPAAFRLGGHTTALMITAEPAGGVPAPTTPVLVRVSI